MNCQPQFLNELEVTPLSDGEHWRLEHGLNYLDARGELHCVPAGFVTDFASIPSLAKLGLTGLILGLLVMVCGALDQTYGWFNFGFGMFALGCLVIWLSDDFEDDDRLDAPATLHDNGYRRPRLGAKPWRMKFYWDWILFQAMRVNGIELWKCCIVWLAVAGFGWWAWHSDRGLSQSAAGGRSEALRTASDSISAAALRVETTRAPAEEEKT